METKKTLEQDAEQFNQYLQSLSINDLQTLSFDMNNLIKEINEKLLNGELENLAETDTAVDILKYYRKNLEGE